MELTKQVIKDAQDLGYSYKKTYDSGVQLWEREQRAEVILLVPISEKFSIIAYRDLTPEESFIEGTTA